MVEVKKFVDQLIATGMDKDKAAEKVKNVIAKIKEKKGDVPDNEVEALIGFALAKIASRKGERYKGICIGYGGKFDQNKKYADNTLVFFNNEKTRARVLVTETNKDGYTFENVTYGAALKQVDGAEVAVPLDMRKFLDVNQKFENRGYGKPLKARYSRKCYFIVENELAIVTGNLDPIAGAEYYIYGKKKDYKGTIYISVGASGIQKSAALTNNELWDAIYKFAESSDFAMPLEDVIALEPNEVKLTSGFIKNGGDTKSGGRWVVINNDEFQEGQFGFSSNEDAAAALSLAQVGNEVFALVQGMKADPSRDNQAVKVLSVIVNPASNANANLINDIEIFIEE